MRMPSMSTLRQVAIFSGVIGISGCMYLHTKVIDTISKSPYFRAAFKVLRAHPGAITLLGEPIKQLGFDIGDEENYCNGKFAQFHVRVKGQNDKGMMYFWAELNDEQAWTIQRLELEVNKHPKKRLLVKSVEASE